MTSRAWSVKTSVIALERKCPLNVTSAVTRLMLHSPDGHTFDTTVSLYSKNMQM